jgi:hypothetical protein
MIAARRRHSQQRSRSVGKLLRFVGHGETPGCERISQRPLPARAPLEAAFGPALAVEPGTVLACWRA